jgi:hypothetical protein
MTYIPTPNDAFTALRCRFEQRYAPARAKLREEIDLLWRSDTMHIILPAPLPGDKAPHNMYTYQELEIPAWVPAQSLYNHDWGA